MFGSTEPTAYDLRFSVFGIPVRVSVWFWVLGLILGYDFVHRGFEYLLAWTLVVFVSILVHELGHAWVARGFGYPPRILLYQFGGLTMYEPYHRYTRSRAIAITIAGPAAGFVLCGLAWTLSTYGLPALRESLSMKSFLLIGSITSMLVFVNLWWGLLNLLPVLPLDGGQICREICLTYSPRNGVLHARRIGAVISGMAAAYFFTRQQPFAAVMFAMLCAQNIAALQPTQRW